MRIGLIGAGNMARALARGWGEPVLASDSGSGRAAALVAELGGKTGTNAEVARAADVVVLCHKPRQLAAVAAEIAGEARAVASVLGGTSLGELRSAYPGSPVLRLLPNTPVEVGRGIVCVETPEREEDRTLLESLRPLLERGGRVEELPAALMGPATAVMGVGPAYLALVVEAQADAAVRHGLPAALALDFATETLAGTAALLAAHGHDTVGVRRDVTSPGGSTARGLAALERGGLRAAFSDAMDAVVAHR